MSRTVLAHGPRQTTLQVNPTLCWQKKRGEIVLSQNSTDGVYYPKSAFLGVWLRFLIGVIDLVVVGFVSAIVATLVLSLFPPAISEIAASFAVITICLVYYIVLKRSEFRTVGYRMFHVRVVNLRGQRPSVFQMVNRFSFMLLGPLNGIVDLLWISSDESKQALRDKWSQTYVIRDTAEPKGYGPIAMQRYGIMGFNFLFAEVLEGTVQAP
ncbi:MAG: hypothetical protein DRH08_04800 [Deltaproteobacteria bacterium]|nr:MAG: hypothetical protein DRH08_04800 [Deltaproteobacteria bacterium]